MKTRTLSVKEGNQLRISRFPNISTSGSIKGMKDKYWGKNALCVKCGSYIYNVSSEPSIYEQAN